MCLELRIVEEKRHSSSRSQFTLQSPAVIDRQTIKDRNFLFVIFEYGEKETKKKEICKLSEIYISFNNRHRFLRIKCRVLIFSCEKSVNIIYFFNSELPGSINAFRLTIVPIGRSAYATSVLNLFMRSHGPNPSILTSA